MTFKGYLILGALLVGVIAVQYRLKRILHDQRVCGSSVVMSASGFVDCYDATIVEIGFPFVFERKTIPNDVSIAFSWEGPRRLGNSAYSLSFFLDIAVLFMPLFLLIKFLDDRL